MMYKNVLFGTIFTVSIFSSNLHSSEVTSLISNEPTPETTITGVGTEEVLFEAAQIIADALVNISEVGAEAANVATEEKKETAEGEAEEKIATAKTEADKVVENVKIIAETIVKTAESFGIDISNIAPKEKKEIAEGMVEAAIEVADVGTTIVVENGKVEAEEMIQDSEIFDVGNIIVEAKSETTEVETKTKIEATKDEDADIQNVNVEVASSVVEEQKEAVKATIECAKGETEAIIKTSDENLGFKVAKKLVPVLGVALILYAAVKLAPSVIN